MKIKKLPLFLCFILVFVLMSSVVMAAPIQHDVSQGDVVIESCGANCPGHVITGTTSSNTIVVKEGTHRITFDKVNVEIKNPKSPEKTVPFTIFAPADVELILKGESKLYGPVAILGVTDDAEPTKCADLTIAEASRGSLVCTVKDTGMMLSNLTIKGGELSVNPAEAYVGYETWGLLVENEFIMENGYVDITAANAEGDVSSSVAIYAGTGFTVCNGELFAMSGNVQGAYSSASGVVTGAVDISGGLITAVGGEASGEELTVSNGIFCDEIYMENASVFALSYAEADTAESYGIFSYGDLMMVNARSLCYGGKTPLSIGVSVASVDLLKGSFLAAMGDPYVTSHENYGLFLHSADGKVTGSDSTLLAKGHLAAVDGNYSSDPFASFNCTEKLSDTDYEGAGKSAYGGYSTLPSCKYLYLGKTYEVTFNANGGVGTVPQTKSYYYEDVIVLPDADDLVKNGATFLGWSTDPEGNWYFEPGDEYAVNWVDEVLYAIWEENYVNPFTDVKESDYFYTPVQWAVKEGVTAGMSETLFGPEITCTRAHAVTFLWRTAGEPEPMTNDMPFTDVPSDQYYYKAVQWAVEEGITAGTSATTFSPDSPCTRGQIVSFLWRFAREPEPLLEEMPFTDVSAGMYYENPVLWAAYYGITAGITPTLFGPDSPCTRGQIVCFLYRYVNILS